MNINYLINSTFIVVGMLTIIIFVVTFNVYEYLAVENYIKESITISLGFLGAFATLGTAYIAANLFNDWREQKKYEVIYSLSLDALTIYMKAKDNYFKYLTQYCRDHEYELLTYSEADNFINEALLKIRILSAASNKLKIANLEEEIDNLTIQYGSIPKDIETESQLRKLSYTDAKEIFDHIFKKDEILRDKLINNFELDLNNL